MAATTAADDGDRPRLTKSAVVGRALELADRDGVEALTIRRLATELGVTPMALYWHFRSKEDLLSGLSDHVWSEVDLEVDQSASWPDQLRVIMKSLVAVLRAHPSGAQLVLSHKKESEGSMRAAEIALGVLRGAGFDAEQASEITRSGMWTALTLVMSEPGFEPDVQPGLDDAERAELLRRKRIQFAMLPIEKFPHLVECAGPFTTGDAEFHYRFGIDLFIAGVEALAP
ncbi:MAG TPA: TetR/AcrR family transcriptional regulator C-terminal domain-containing protein [Streptosporangiaceae bacterium]|nr:TetR/AcrR family transcriptional regulator C-terminal domain-containing protein [Streptosporangiaceae bacterium]